MDEENIGSEKPSAQETGSRSEYRSALNGGAHKYRSCNLSYCPRPSRKNSPISGFKAARSVPSGLWAELSLLNDPFSWEGIVDRVKTGERLKELRETNVEFGRTFCRISRLLDIRIASEKRDDVDSSVVCSFDCRHCRSYRTRAKTGGGRVNISTPSFLETGETSCLSHLGEKGVNYAENGNFKLETLLLYSFYSKVPLTDIIVLKEGFRFDADGRLIWEEYENLHDKSDLDNDGK